MNIINHRFVCLFRFASLHIVLRLNCCVNVGYRHTEGLSYINLCPKQWPHDQFHVEETNSEKTEGTKYNLNYAEKRVLRFAHC